MAIVVSVGAICPAGFGSTAGIEAITKPNSDVTLSFVRPGRIAELLVKEGQQVRRGDVLVRQDAAVERAQAAQLKAQAEDATRVKAEEAKLDQKRVDLKKIERAAAQGAATELEVAHARLEVTIADLSLDLAKFQQLQDRRKYEEAKLQLERMQLSSPITGKVERVFVEPGESVNALAEVVRVVQTDPLRIDVAVPLERAGALDVGRGAWIAFSPAGEKKLPGRIVHVGSVADAASETLRVSVEAANRTGRIAGQRVWVSFSNAAVSDNQTGKQKE